MSAVIIARSNDALQINPPNANRSLTQSGSNWLWAVTALFGLTFFGFLTWTILRNTKARIGVAETRKGHDNNLAHVGREPHGYVETSHLRECVFHYLFTIAAFMGFITYFTMASDLGNTPVRQYLNNDANSEQTRQVFYVRYIYWFLAWPLIVIANLLLSGVSWATILFAVALQEIWVVTWLSGALVRTSYRWGYFAFGLFSYFVLAYVLLSWGIQHARRIQTSKDYTLLAGLLVLVWLAFPVAWGISEGGNKLSVTGEMIFYGILDIIAVPIYGTLFLLSTKRFGPSLFRFTQTGRIDGLDNIHTPLTSTHVESGVPSQNYAGQAHI